MKDILYVAFVTVMVVVSTFTLGFVLDAKISRMQMQIDELQARLLEAKE